MQAPTPDSAVIPARTIGIVPTIGGKYFALAVLFSMNLLNYVDRYSFFAVGADIQKELGIRDDRFGYLAASFMIAAAGGVAEDAVAELVLVPVRASCPACKAVTVAEEQVLACSSCGSVDVELTTGDELMLESIEYAET